MLKAGHVLIWMLYTLQIIHIVFLALINFFSIAGVFDTIDIRTVCSAFFKSHQVSCFEKHRTFIHFFFTLGAQASSSESRKGHLLYDRIPALFDYDCTEERLLEHCQWKIENGGSHLIFLAFQGSHTASQHTVHSRAAQWNQIQLNKCAHTVQAACIAQRQPHSIFWACCES